MWFDQFDIPKLKSQFPGQCFQSCKDYWLVCPHCRNILQKKELEKNYQVCLKCDYYFRMTARERVQLLTDEGSFEEYDTNWVSTDPLKFHDQKPYLERLKVAHQKTGLMDAFISGKGRLNGRLFYLGVFE